MNKKKLQLVTDLMENSRSNAEKRVEDVFDKVIEIIRKVGNSGYTQCLIVFSNKPISKYYCLKRVPKLTLKRTIQKLKSEGIYCKLIYRHTSPVGYNITCRWNKNYSKCLIL